MLEIVLYAVGIMYTPGPVNLMGLNAGLQNRLRQTLGFFVGVGLSMLVLFLVFGYTGQAVVRPAYLPFIALVGTAFIVWLGVKLLRAEVDPDSSAPTAVLGLREGFLLQLLNPKATLATLPIATIQFPAQQITGIGILGVSLLLSMLAMGAPGSYAVLGTVAGRWITSRWVIRGFNRVMALLLFYVAATILHEHVYRAVAGY